MCVFCFQYSNKAVNNVFKRIFPLRYFMFCYDIAMKNELKWINKFNSCIRANAKKSKMRNKKSNKQCKRQKMDSNFSLYALLNLIFFSEWEMNKKLILLMKWNDTTMWMHTTMKIYQSQCVEVSKMKNIKFPQKAFLISLDLPFSASFIVRRETAFSLFLCRVLSRHKN